MARRRIADLLRRRPGDSLVAEYRATLSLPLGVNHDKRTVRRTTRAGKPYYAPVTVPEHESWKQAAALALVSWPPLGPSFPGYLEFDYRIHCSLRRDDDNVLKSVRDACCRRLQTDDYRVLYSVQEKLICPRGEECVDVRILARLPEGAPPWP